MSGSTTKKLCKVVDITPDLDAVNINGKICDLQIMESVDVCGNALSIAHFNLVDETASIKTQVTGLGKIKNGDMLKIKNGRVDIVNNKLVLSNDIWTKMTVAGTKMETGNKIANISEIHYNARVIQPTQNTEEADSK